MLLMRTFSWDKEAAVAYRPSPLTNLWYSILLNDAFLQIVITQSQGHELPDSGKSRILAMLESFRNKSKINTVNR